MDHIMDDVMLFNTYIGPPRPQHHHPFPTSTSTTTTRQRVTLTAIPLLSVWSVWGVILLRVDPQSLCTTLITQCWHNCSDKFDPELWRQTYSPAPPPSVTVLGLPLMGIDSCWPAKRPSLISLVFVLAWRPVALSCVGINVCGIYILPLEGSICG